MQDRTDQIDYLTGHGSDRPYPPGVGLPGTGEKFTTDGRPETWAGNTFVSHVPPATEGYAALLDVQEAMKTSRFSTLIAWLPAPSFHMTVFQGMSPGKAGTSDWPEGLAPDADRAEGTDHLRARTQALRLPIVPVRARRLFGGFSVVLEGADGAAEAALRDARVRLREAIGMRPADFDDYVFHITLGYPLAWLSPALARDLVAFSAETFARAEPRLQAIGLGPCQLCEFDTMHHFEPVSTLG